MPVSIVVEVLGSTAPPGAADAPLLTAEGFPALGLKELYLFDDADPKASAASRVGGWVATPDTGGSASPAGSKTNASGGGGVVFTSVAGVAAADTIDVAQPFTSVWSGSLSSVMNTGTTPFPTGIMSFAEWAGTAALRGLRWNTSESVDPTTSSVLHCAIFKALANGTGSSVVVADTSAEGTYDDFMTFVMSGDGTPTTCNYTFQILKAGSLVFNQTIAVNVADMVNGGSSQTSTLLHPRVGLNSSGAANDGSQTVDVFAVYTRQLATARLVELDTAAREIATARGRTL